MSAIDTFAFHNVIVFPRTRCAPVRAFAEDVIQNSHVPFVTPRWTVEIGDDGTQRLVQHWVKSEKPV